MVESQIAGLWKNDVPFIFFTLLIENIQTNVSNVHILSPFRLIVTDFDPKPVPREKTFPFNYQITWSKIKVKLLVNVQMISSTPSLKSSQTFHSTCH